MPCRLFLVFVLALTTVTVYADSATWSCQQDQQTNEWVCIGDSAPAKATNAKPAPDEAHQFVEPVISPAEIKASPPTPAEPIIKQAPVIAEPVAPTPLTPVESDQPVVAQPAVPIAGKQAATTCKDNCQSKARQGVVEEEGGFGFRLLDPIFDHQEEQIFANLYGKLKNDPWESCLDQRGTQRSWEPALDVRNKSPLDVKSNYSEIFDNEIGNYIGNVEIGRADQRALSNAANYDSVSETLDLQGDVYYSEDEIALHSNSATLKLGADQAKLRDTLFIYPAAPARGYAEAAYRDSKTLSHYTGVTYTSCRPGNQDWAVHASELKLNRSTGRGSAKNAWVEFKGYPVFYSPYFSFPIDNRRLSGLLAPAYNYTQRGGLSLSVPYYWNIAPNYDATFTPRYLTSRGALLGTDFRYLTEMSRGEANIEYMPNDDIENNSRYLGKLRHTTRFTPNINANLDLRYVSDKNYFADLGNALSFPNFSFIKSRADINYIREGVALTGRLESYQTIDPSLKGPQIPYRRLPQVNLNLNHSFDSMPVDIAMESEAVHFQHSSRVNAQRYNVKPSVSFPLQTASGYVTPKAAVQYTEYSLDETLSGLPNDISRTLPIMSVDSGVFLERGLDFAGHNFTHTLEPRLFYLYIPKTDQSDIPLFDSSLYDFWYSSMFRENRFSGSDRIQDANQLTLALTSRLLDPRTGWERLKFNIGEIFYFRNREVTLCGQYEKAEGNTLCSISQYVETEQTSPLVTELGSELSEHFAIDTGLQWDHNNNRIVRGKAVLHYQNQPDEIINLGFLYRRSPLPTTQSNVIANSNDITQSDISFRWPIYANWYAVGRWQYSWLFNETQDGFLGLEKENCCWRFRIIGRRYLNSLNQINGQDSLAVDGAAQTGIFFQIELKGFTGIGEKLDDFFETSIYGYRKPTK